MTGVNYTEYQKLEYLEFLYNSSLEKFLNFILRQLKNEKDIKLGILAYLIVMNLMKIIIMKNLKIFSKYCFKKKKAMSWSILDFNIYVKIIMVVFKTGGERLLSNGAISNI